MYLLQGEDEVVAIVDVDGGKEDEKKLPLNELAPIPTKNELIGNHPFVSSDTAQLEKKTVRLSPVN